MQTDALIGTMSDDKLHILTNSLLEQKIISHSKDASSDNNASIAGIVQDGIIALLDVSTLPEDKEECSKGTTPALSAGKTLSFLLSFMRILRINPFKTFISLCCNLMLICKTQILSVSL